MNQMSTAADNTDPIEVGVTVPLSPSDAYAAFVHSYGDWISAEFRIGESQPSTVVIEDRPGGRWYERGSDGVETPWGSVSSARPGESITLNWNIGSDWAFHADQASTITVDFAAAEQGTAVTLRHDDFDRHQEGAAELRSQMAGEYGYDQTMADFAAYAGSAGGSAAE